MSDQVMTLVHGIEDGNWDIEHVLSEFAAMLDRGWEVNFNSASKPQGLQPKYLQMPSSLRYAFHHHHHSLCSALRRLSFIPWLIVKSLPSLPSPRRLPPRAQLRPKRAVLKLQHAPHPGHFRRLDNASACLAFSRRVTIDFVSFARSSSKRLRGPDRPSAGSQGTTRCSRAGRAAAGRVEESESVSESGVA